MISPPATVLCLAARRVNNNLVLAPWGKSLVDTRFTLGLSGVPLILS